ncbi:MAG: peptidase [Sphingomonas bacterium]|uniref:S9 family peptidase n=1 Tax=Sphingomonas bacterium TaxID=1895847 RepID=UPI00261B0152|nr:S9 family peptidase [Sphingomonas bacterium]MDB5709487.1 peptidase [Sphingomonas bacterium]
MRLRFAAILLAATAATPSLAAPIHQYGGLALAPKGDVIATIEEGSADHEVVTLRSAKTGKVLRTVDPCAKCGYAGLTFGPDGSLAYLARDRAAHTVTLMVDGGKTQRTIATIGGIAQTPRWSPDGKRIALLVTIGAAKESGATQAGVRQVGEIGEHSDEQRLAVFDAGGAPVAAAAVKPVSPADRYVYEYDWTPDGRGFVATTAVGNGDNNWWVATLDAIDGSTGDVRNIAKPKTQINFPRLSPDGKWVAFICGLMSDFGSVGGDLCIVPVAGGDVINISAEQKASFTSIAWTRGGLRATALSGEAFQITEVKFWVDGQRTNSFLMTWFSKPISASAGDGRAAFSADGSRVALVAQDFSHAAAIFAGRSAAPVQITHDNDAAPVLAEARNITWKNDGFDVQGWLLAPPGADPAVKHAMVTVVHGGPAAANVPSYIQRGASADLLAAGYYVFLPNPRGSYGQGEAFTAANKRDFGGGDLRDILTGIDAVEKVAPVDDARLGLTGGSYGGFMAMWANTQTNRFKAIVAGAGLSNWISYYGTNGIDQWMLPFFGKTMYDDPKAYEDVSAIYHMKKAKTPTFIYVGERDIEVPPTQSVEYWHALKDMGVETSLVIYPEEGHGIRGPANVADVRKRTVAWFDRFLGK